MSEINAIIQAFKKHVPLGCLRFVIVVFPDHTHLLFLNIKIISFYKRCLHVR